MAFRIHPDGCDRLGGDAFAAAGEAEPLRSSLP